MARISASILSADFLNLGRQVSELEGAVDSLHIDVMDGHFVPNISIGAPIVQALRKATKLPLETHLMITNPEPYIKPFADAGSDSIILHAETTMEPLKLIGEIKSLGKKAGISINPATGVIAIEKLIPQLDLVLVMSVNPGFSGQTFIREVLPKIREIRKLSKTIDIQVDGGINATNAGDIIKAGATTLVASSAIFAKPDIRKAAQELRESAESAGKKI